MMFDFRDVAAASKAEQIRAFAVEQTIEFHRDQTSLGVGFTTGDFLNMTKCIEDYIHHGDTGNSIISAIEEGYNEGRFQVKEAVEEWYTNVDLNDLFSSKGWTNIKKAED